jgi:predicted DNA-binding ribbon-helix-helix protein
LYAVSDNYVVSLMTLQKRTLRLAQHNTSVALEPEFWSALEQFAQMRGQTVPQLVATIDAARTSPLASALRVHVLQSTQRCG